MVRCGPCRLSKTARRLRRNQAVPVCRAFRERSVSLRRSSDEQSYNLCGLQKIPENIVWICIVECIFRGFQPALIALSRGSALPDLLWTQVSRSQYAETSFRLYQVAREDLRITQLSFVLNS